MEGEETKEGEKRGGAIQGEEETMGHGIRLSSASCLTLVPSWLSTVDDHNKNRTT